MEFFFIIFYKKVDKVGIEMLYFVNKILLFEQLIFGGKESALIDFVLCFVLPPANGSGTGIAAVSA